MDVIEEDEMLDGMDTFLEKVRELSSEIEALSNILDPIIDNINKLNMGTLLDLSMKDKSMYLESGDVDDNKNIPENINISFLHIQHMSIQIYTPCHVEHLQPTRLRRYESCS